MFPLHCLPQILGHQCWSHLCIQLQHVVCNSTGPNALMRVMRALNPVIQRLLSSSA